ncbi:hypothetical protein B9Z19DRAFT_788994 [Tuber borchii]|uniref:Uncharacterized protein n=1 Tax=Tuber borchii TaxID=42251 RepID=A0A2T6ZWN3_TUBBO|nr:hypothetical protein B9Z19DRAFT_788994 [Tuber borchii]
MRVKFIADANIWGVFLSDFPQCYDTHDDGLLNLMAQKLGLQQEGETAFMDAYSRRVRALPGHERFRTGVSLRPPLKEPSELPKSSLPEDRFILFVSFPYFGRSSEEITLGQERESLKLLDFRLLGVDARDRMVKVSEEVRVGIREILVHQARYMIFDNYTMATFRSKEDSSRDQVPLHRFQERVGAFRAMIHMIANRTELELWTLGKLQASLHKLEEDIDQMISDANDHEDSQGAKKKQERARDLLTALNRLSVDLFAAVSVAERQIAILQDLHSVFLTSYRTKTKDYERGYPLRRNPFYRNVAPIPILSENPEQIWPNTLDTINEVVEERKSFIKKVKELVENMDIRRKIFAAFLKSDQAEAAPSEETAQKTMGAVKSTEDAIRETQKVIEETQAELVKQGQTLSGFTLVTTAFLPLDFCCSYYGMQTMREFGGGSALLSLRQFWLATAPTLVGILLLTVLVIIWKREWAIDLRR